MNLDAHKQPEWMMQVLLKEYEMLRLEINMFNQYRQILLTASAGLLAAALGAASTYYAGTNHPPLHAEVLLALASVFVTGGLLLAELRARICKAAAYLHSYLRPRVLGICGSDDEDVLMNWEGYLAKKDKFKSGWYLLIDHIAWLMFVVPALLAMAGAWFAPSAGTPRGVLGVWSALIVLLTAHTTHLSLRLNKGPDMRRHARHNPV